MDFKLCDEVSKLFDDYLYESGELCNIPVEYAGFGLSKHQKLAPLKIRRYDYIITFWSDGFYNLEKRNCQQYFRLTPNRKVKDPNKILELIKCLKSMECKDETN